MNLSPKGQAWLDRHRAEHQRGTNAFAGNMILNFEAQIADLIRMTQAYTVLDYGCGKACGWLEGLGDRLDVLPTLYDPAVEEYATRPGEAFDLVVCCDVIEHIPEADVPAVLADISSFALRGVFISFCCRPSWTKFEDGADPHATIKPAAWWQDQFFKHLRPDLLFWSEESP